MIFLEAFIVSLLGLILGSFATAITYRAPRGIPWAFGTKSTDSDVSAHRSVCPSCKTKLTLRDLVPLLSWGLSGGKCRHCQAPIGYIYPAIELAVLFGCLLIYALKGWGLESFVMMALVPFLVALFAIDLEFMILPNALVGMIGALGLLRFALAGILSVEAVIFEYILGAVVYGAVAWGLRFLMSKWLKKEAMGFGDVKFFAVAGLWLGLGELSSFCILSGGLLIIMAPFWQHVVNKREIAFGPALILAFFGLLLFDGSLLF